MEKFQEIKENLPKDIYTINTSNFSLKLLLMLSLILLGLNLAISANFILNMIGILILGSMYAHGVELQHQLLHGHGFKSVKLNRFFGVFTGLPMLVSYSHYQLRHLWHHRFVGTDKDTEFFQYNLSSDHLKFREFIAHMFDYGFVFKFFRNVKIALLGLPIEREISCRKSIAKKIRWEYLFIFACFLGFLLLSYNTGNINLFFKCWLFPLLLVAIPVHFLIEFPEHILCERGNRNPLMNTRSIKGSKFSFWFTNGNNFHAEHHLFPSIPMNKLPAVHEKTCSFIGTSNKTYFEFYTAIVK